MKILVTGGAGFIGSNVVDAYLSEGHRVTVIDDLSSGKWENINRKAKFYLLDIRDRATLERVFEKEKFDIVNHHAAQISVPMSVANPQLDADINVTGFLNILELSVKYRVKKIIFISSGGALYGEAEEYPTSESYPPKPLSPYAITKYVSENYLYFYNKQYGLDYTVLRYANVYGPRQIPHGEAGVVSIFMTRLKEGKDCTIYAFSDEPEGMKRDYVYVEDVAKANILALNKGSLEAINIGTGVATSTSELFNIVYETLSKSTKIAKNLKKPKSGPERPGDLRRSCLNIAKAKKVLGWKPENSLKKGIEKTVKWFLGEDY
ncbi:MAG: SDR family NAD(P)-dependent oxidoreductase [Proteobacteria bacterium]|nr:SDR family NAD(P)-dependent oxidoreductase [Pseudomonadota bacterium]